jgi:hypothetical protein
MPAPTFISATSVTDYQASGTPKSVSLTTQAGDLVVVYGGSEDSPYTLGTPSGNGISFTLHKSLINLNFSTAYIWSGVDNTGGVSWTLQIAQAGGAGVWGFTAVVFRAHGGAGASASGSIDGAFPSQAISTGANSALVVFDSDWNASDGGTRVWRTINGTTPTAGNGLELDYSRNVSHYTIYGGYYPDVGTAGSKTVGFTDPSQKYSLVVLEVLAGAAPTGATIAWLTA